MSDPLEDALRVHGERWRAGLSPDPELSDALAAARRRRRAAPALLAAAAVVAVVAVAVGVAALTGQSRSNTAASPQSTVTTAPAPSTSRSRPHNGGAASCVGPVLSLVRDSPTGERSTGRMRTRVAPGEDLTVYGSYYLAECDDTGGGGGPAAPLAEVALTLTTSDHRTIALVTAHPDARESFTATVGIPSDAPNGAAKITDSLGDSIALDIAAPTTSPGASLSPGERTLALAAAHAEADRYATNKNDPQTSGWPANITTVTAQAGTGRVRSSNTGHPCTSGRVIRIQLIGDLPGVVAPPPKLPGSPPVDLSVHGDLLTVDATSGLTCLLSVAIGSVTPTDGSTILYSR